MRYKQEINDIMWAIKNSFDSARDHGTEFTHIVKLQGILEELEKNAYKDGFRDAEMIFYELG